MSKYHQYESDKQGKKYYIITENNKKIILGLVAIVILQFTKDEQRKQRYINRHKANKILSKSGIESIDTAGFRSRWLLWNKPTIFYDHARPVAQ
jgi:hypothetical protein